MLSFPPHVVVRDVTNPSKLFLSDSIAIVPISSVAKSISGRQAVYSRYFVRGRSIRDARFLRAEEEVIRLLPCRIYLDDHICRSGHFISFIIENSCAVKRVELCLLLLYSRSFIFKILYLPTLPGNELKHTQPQSSPLSHAMLIILTLPLFRTESQYTCSW